MLSWINRWGAQILTGSTAAATTVSVALGDKSTGLALVSWSWVAVVWCLKAGGWR